MSDAQALERILDRIDGRGYKTYSEIRGHFEFDRFTLFVDHVQADPFAAPSKLRLRVPMREARLPEDLQTSKIRRIALADFLARCCRDALKGFRDSGSPRRARRGASSGPKRGSGKSGEIFIDAGGQEVLERTAIKIDSDWVEARIEAGLPAAGRRILGREAQRMLVEQLPELVERGLLAENLSLGDMREFVECVENQEAIRSQLDASGSVGFVADGSLLPRASGASELPMAEADATRFHSPESMAVEMDVPNPAPGARQGRLRGMAIRSGITLIVGGGYHGKTTLLRALETSVYPHIPGDGREYVVAAADLVKVRAEDGRSVRGVDIHGFIGILPGGERARLPHSFSSSDASGSTSQAAAIAEALEVGARGILLDEDTCATNFMIRDARMQRLVDAAHEPITPFVDRVRELRDTLGVSTVLVMGGCGDYFGVADSVIMMRDYRAEDVTDEAHRIAAEYADDRVEESREALVGVAPRSPLSESFVAARGRREESISARGRDSILYGPETIDLRGLGQLVDTSQTRAIGRAIRLASQHLMGGHRDGPEEIAPSMADILASLEAILDDEGVDALDRYGVQHPSERHPGNLARPRRHEIAGAINRMRSLGVRPLTAP